MVRTASSPGSWQRNSAVAGRNIIRALSGGLSGNIGAQGFALLVQMVVALISIPIFASLWGLESYGIWLILYTLPAYLALADFGFVGAAANAMTAAHARGEKAQARAMFRQLTGSAFALGTGLLVLATMLLLPGAGRWLSFAQVAAEGQAEIVIMALTAHAIFALWSRTLYCALRATGHFAKGAYCIGLTALVDVGLAAGLALAGYGLAGAAIGFAAGQALGLAAMAVLLRRSARGFKPGVMPHGVSELAALTSPALALIVLAIGQAILLQGAVVALGIAAGAAAVPAFTAMRTLARVGVQGVAAISQAVTPELTMARARGDSEREQELIALNLLSAAMIALPCAVALAMFGPQFIELWSAGVIMAEPALAWVLALALLAGALWGPLASFLTAVNQQSRFAPALLLAALGGISLAFVLAKDLGGVGAAWAVLAVELAMLVWCSRQAAKAGFLSRDTLQQVPARAIAMVRRRLGLGG